MKLYTVKTGKQELEFVGISCIITDNCIKIENNIHGNFIVPTLKKAELIKEEDFKIFINNKIKDNAKSEKYDVTERARLGLCLTINEISDRNVKANNSLEELLSVAIGEASMCWSETPKGTFDDKKASEISEKLIKNIKCLYNPRIEYLEQFDIIK